MKFAAMLVMLLFSCAGSTRVAPREVSRASAEARERAELVGLLEVEVSEGNRLRSEAVAHNDDAPQPTRVAEPVGKTPRLIVFTAVEWCAPCRKLEAELKRLGAMAYAGKNGSRHTWAEDIGTSSNFFIQVCDISDDAETPEQALATRYDVTAVPTIVRIAANGKEESRFVGVIDAETLCRYQAGKWKPPKPVIDTQRIAIVN